MKTLFILLVIYYVVSYAVVVWALMYPAGEVYRAERVPVPWKYHLLVTLIPFFGVWVSIISLIGDAANHLMGEELKRYKSSKIQKD